MEIGGWFLKIYILISFLFLFSLGFSSFVIAEHNNGTAPFLQDEVDHLYVSRGGELKVDLDRYFEDLEENVLTYGVNQSKVKNLDVSFSRSFIIIKLGENFTNYEKFQIYVSDGDGDTGNHTFISDFVYVFEKVNKTINKTLVKNETSGNEDNSSNDGGGKNSSNLSKGGGLIKGNDEKPKDLAPVREIDSKILIRILIVVAVVVVFVFIMVKKRKKARELESDNSYYESN